MNPYTGKGVRPTPAALSAGTPQHSAHPSPPDDREQRRYRLVVCLARVNLAMLRWDECAANAVLPADLRRGKR